MHQSWRGVFGLVALLLVVGQMVVAAENTMRSEAVHFKKGSSGATIRGQVHGSATVDYLVGAKQGQRMTVQLRTDNRANYFNILLPGAQAEAMYNSSVDDNQYAGLLPASGTYTIRVYLMRSAARRHERAHFTLDIGITHATMDENTAAAPVTVASTDALVAGTPYHAPGHLPCAMTKGQPMGTCPFGVTRQGAGKGAVTITKPDSRSRTIFFENGKAAFADVSQADPGEFSAQRQDDLNLIHIGEERYEIPDAVINGG